MHPALIGTLRRLFHYALGGMGSGEIVNRDLAPSMDVSTGIATVLCIHHYLGRQEQPGIPQTVVGHNRIIPISLNAENCHFDEPLLGKNKCRFSWKMTKNAMVRLTKSVRTMAVFTI